MSRNQSVIIVMVRMEAERMKVDMNELQKGEAEVQAIQWLPAKELVKQVEQVSGKSFSYDTLRTWIDRYGFPKPLKKYLGRGRGRVGLYPEFVCDIIVDVLKEKERGHPLKDTIAKSFMKIEHFTWVTFWHFCTCLFIAYGVEYLKILKKRIKTEIDENVEMNYDEIVENLNHIRDKEKTQKIITEKVLNNFPDSQRDVFENAIGNYFIAERTLLFNIGFIEFFTGQDNPPQYIGKIKTIICNGDSIEGKLEEFAGIMQHDAFKAIKRKIESLKNEG